MKNPSRRVTGAVLMTAALLLGGGIWALTGGQAPLSVPPASGGGNAKRASAPQRLSDELSSLCDYYSFAVNKERAVLGACIQVRLQTSGQGQTVCVRGTSEKPVVVKSTGATDLWATIDVRDDIILENSWKVLTDWKMVSSGGVQLSSYASVIRFGRMFDFGEDTWQRYIEQRREQGADVSADLVERREKTEVRRLRLKELDNKKSAIHLIL
jgi:hypothetical protein